MARMFPQLTSALQTFIEEQQLFFVATAAEDGRVNLSPKGLDSLKVLHPGQLLWLNLTGSGNETAAHLLRVNRMTLMFCSFTEQPLILRVYGKARTIHANDADWDKYLAHFGDHYTGARQLYLMNVESAQTSCGFAVPRYDFKEQRSRLLDSAERRGREGIEEYWQEKNRTSIDNFPTGMPGLEELRSE
ncbi:MAG: pyridoxamine 5'-phosphate oxidase family protein [Bacteroidota bacterium]